MKKQESLVSKDLMTIAWVLVLGAMAPLLDSTMVNIAIHSLVKDLNSSVAIVQWTITGYVLATGIAVPFSSWLLNKFDGKNVFLAGEMLFAIGSILSALSPNINFFNRGSTIAGLCWWSHHAAADNLISPINWSRDNGQNDGYSWLANYSRSFDRSCDRRYYR